MGIDCVRYIENIGDIDGDSRLDEGISSTP